MEKDNDINFETYKKTKHARRLLYSVQRRLESLRDASGEAAQKVKEELEEQIRFLCDELNEFDSKYDGVQQAGIGLAIFAVGALAGWVACAL